jgi:hypothetical protein
VSPSSLRQMLRNTLCGRWSWPEEKRAPPSSCAGSTAVVRMVGAARVRMGRGVPTEGPAVERRRMKQPTRAGTDPARCRGRRGAGREGSQRAGGDDPVERSVLGQALGAVHCGQSSGVAEPGQPIAGVVDELGVDVD